MSNFLVIMNHNDLIFHYFHVMYKYIYIHIHIHHYASYHIILGGTRLYCTVLYSILIKLHYIISSLYSILLLYILLYAIIPYL